VASCRRSVLLIEQRQRPWCSGVQVLVAQVSHCCMSPGCTKTPVRMEMWRLGSMPRGDLLASGRMSRM